jgi:hypothetical protein
MVWAALPAAQATNDDFQAITNALGQASQRGNLAAQTLWGFALVAQSSSPGTAAGGL